ncbi:uncharacterized protein LOC130688730 [Daphnia carinata]|uniref:uncharacterized protein LOC130688730 n=1 Tax=Daphnia carinata TaxID=120202 RepID=UPI00257BE3D2|nr:uncharacterized protein LOC130688730 [Daphnia carinata]XP_057367733.1 uncharacterized protein LOC130688730 [Daphnia carinata]
MTEQCKLPLRIITYLVPGLSVELFESISQYLESSLGKETMLFYESRFDGPQSDRIDPFETKVADLAFITGAAYQKLIKEDNKNWELLPVGGVYPHLTKGESAGYYADIIIHKNSKERTKDFLDLRGANWATNNPCSTSGHFVMLKALKEYGENPSFFGSVLNSGSHLNSIHMVASRKADVASVDSNVLAFAMAKNPALAHDLHIFTSIGPLPPYPIMIRSSMAVEQKNGICDALLQLENVVPWNKLCADLRLLRFVKIDKDIYLEDRESRDALVNLSASVRYY